MKTKKQIETIWSVLVIPVLLPLRLTSSVCNSCYKATLTVFNYHPAVMLIKYILNEKKRREDENEGSFMISSSDREPLFLDELSLSGFDLKESQEEAVKSVFRSLEQKWSSLLEENASLRDRVKSLETSQKFLMACSSSALGDLNFASVVANPKKCFPSLPVSVRDFDRYKDNITHRFTETLEVKCSTRVQSIAYNDTHGMVATVGWDCFIKLYTTNGKKLFNTEGNRSLRQKMLDEGLITKELQYDFSEKHHRKLYKESHELPKLYNDELSYGQYSVKFNIQNSQLMGVASSAGSVQIFQFKESVDDNDCLFSDFKALRFGNCLCDVNALSFKINECHVALCNDLGSVEIWDFMQQTQLMEFTEHSDIAYNVAFSKNPLFTSLVASAGFDKVVKLYDVRDKHVICELDGHTDDIIGLDFSPDSFGLATGSDDQTCNIYDLRRMSAINTFSFDSAVKNVRFAPGINALATCCSDGSCQIWKIREQPVIGAIVGNHSDICFDVCWGTNGEMIQTCSHDGSWKVWRRC